MASPYGYGNSSLKDKMLAFGNSKREKELKSEVEPEVETVEKVTEEERSPESEAAEKSVEATEEEVDSDGESPKGGIFCCCFGG